MRSLLFVCMANRIRSPLSEYLFRRKLEEAGNEAMQWRIASAGLWTVPGLPVMPLAYQAGVELGLDLSAHRSTPIEDVLLSDFCPIVVMEQGQREALSLTMPNIAARVHLLSELATGQTYDIIDPVGGSPADYLNTANELDRLIGMAMPRLVEIASAG